jgi:hypothetical protein
VADTVDRVGERLARLEVAVVRGFHDNEVRFRQIEAQLQQSEARLNRKIDESTESLLEEIRRLYPRLPEPTL